MTATYSPATGWASLATGLGIGGLTGRSTSKMCRIIHPSSGVAVLNTKILTAQGAYQYQLRIRIRTALETDGPFYFWGGGERGLRDLEKIIL